MHRFNEMIGCREKVKCLLETYPECRDDDKLMLAYYQWYALKLGEKITLEDFYNRTRFSELPAAESITRNRRKVQELYPNLSGKSKARRKAESEFIRKNIVG